jgi:hypothetical protein
VRIITSLTKSYSGEQIEKSEMGGACSLHGGKEWAYRVLVGKSEGKDHLEEPAVYRRIT